MGREVLACQVHAGDVDDNTFNATAWKGALAAQEQLEGVTVEFLDSENMTDLGANIDSFIALGCDVIVTVGFLLTHDTAAAAFDNPDQLFAIVDFPVVDAPPWCTGEVDPGADGELGTFDDTCGGAFAQNVRGLSFQVDEAAFLAGYLAAGMTETGAVGTYGAFNDPFVTLFMDGFVWGVAHFNEVNGTDVKALGWDADTQEGLFTNSFGSLDAARAVGENLLADGADIILPVAGPAGLGTVAACQESGACLVIGVDTDQFLTAPEFGDVFLTSIMKNMDAAVFNTINNVLVLGSLGNEYFGVLANGGVGLAPFHSQESAVPTELKAELAQLELDIIAGNIPVTPAPEE